MKSIFVIFFVISLLDYTIAEVQRVRISGKLMCGKTPAKDIKVKLVDVDMIHDDTMDEKRTNENGEFSVDGQLEESGDIDAALKIYHDCYDGQPCQRTWKFEIPKKYFGRNGQEPPTLELGTMNLEVYWYDEERTCV